MKRAGILRLPLFEAPYVLPESVRDQFGLFTLDAQSPEPIIQVHTPGRLTSAVIKPFTFGLNDYQHSDAPSGIAFDGRNTYNIETKDIPARYRMGSGFTFYKGGATGEVWNGNPAPLNTPFIPMGMGGSFTGNYATLGYGFLPIPESVNLSPDGGRTRQNVPLRINGKKPTYGFLACSADYSFAKVFTDLGRTFDSPTDQFWRDEYGETFDLVFAHWLVGNFFIWRNGSPTFINTRGLVLETDGVRPPCYMDWSYAYATAPYADPSDGNWLYTSTLPAALTLDDDPDLQPYFGNITNGYFFAANIIGIEVFPGQAFTPVLFDPATNQYWLVQFVPKSAKSAQAIQHNQFVSIKYSAEGYLVMTTGNVAGLDNMVFHTQALSIPFDYPTLPAVDPVQLPCFNPCVPNLVL